MDELEQRQKYRNWKFPLHTAANAFTNNFHLITLHYIYSRRLQIKEYTVRIMVYVNVVYIYRTSKREVDSLMSPCFLLSVSIELRY